MARARKKFPQTTYIAMKITSKRSDNMFIAQYMDVGKFFDGVEAPFF